MAERVSELMNRNPVTLSADATIFEAAEQMKENDIGAVVVMKSDNSVCGIVTDRDIVVRAIAAGKDPASTPMHAICSHDLVSVTPETTIDDAITKIRGTAIRRLPVMEGKQLVGMLSLGDLAVERDRASALGQISAAPANV